jgi:hypothetical protein
VTEEGWGAWEMCGAGEVMVGACSSGGNEDCYWGNKERGYYNQALCCPIR